MVSHMKTTINIPESLFEEARQVAHRENTTLKALVEEGLRRVISDRQQGVAFQLRDASFGGQGLQPEFADASWEQIRAASYGERGG